MKKRNKWYLAAGGCIAAGVILVSVGVAAGGWPGITISSKGIHFVGDARENGAYILEKTELEDFSSADISLDYGDFQLIPSDGFYLEYCLSPGSREPEYSVKDGTLSFKEHPGNEIMIMNLGTDWFDGENADYEVKLYVPEDMVFEKFILDNESGDIQAENVEAKTLDWNVEYGDLTAESVKGDQVTITAESGNCTIGACKAETLVFDSEYGDIKLETCEAKEGNIRLESGSLKIQEANLGETVLESAYGDVSFQKCEMDKADITMESGKLEMLKAKLGETKIESAYGDVTVELEDEEASYTMDLSTEYGTIEAPKAGRHFSQDDEESFQMDGSGNKKLTIQCESGDIRIVQADDIENS